MVAKKVLSNQNVTVLAGLASSISDWTKPTLSELQGLANVSGAINWDSLDFNLQASELQDDRTLTDGAGAQSRGYTQFGGAIQFGMPDIADQTSVFRVAYDLFSMPRTELVVAVRMVTSNATAPAAGDQWNIYHVITDATAFGENDVSKFYTINLIARDDVLPNYIVPPAVAVAITLTPSSAQTPSVGDLVFVKATYQGWDVTKMVTWASSDPTKAEVIHPGIVKAVGAGAADITAAYPGATTSTALALTVS